MSVKDKEIEKECTDYFESPFVVQNELIPLRTKNNIRPKSNCDKNGQIWHSSSLRRSSNNDAHLKDAIDRQSRRLKWSETRQEFVERLLDSQNSVTSPQFYHFSNSQQYFQHSRHSQLSNQSLHSRHSQLSKNSHISNQSLHSLHTLHSLHSLHSLHTLHSLHSLHSQHSSSLCALNPIDQTSNTKCRARSVLKSSSFRENNVKNKMDDINYNSLFALNFSDETFNKTLQLLKREATSTIQRLKAIPKSF